MAILPRDRISECYIDPHTAAGASSLFSQLPITFISLHVADELLINGNGAKLLISEGDGVEIMPNIGSIAEIEFGKGVTVKRQGNMVVASYKGIGYYFRNYSPEAAR